jgi:release factor glutamine methyltransferase
VPETTNYNPSRISFQGSVPGPLIAAGAAALASAGVEHPRLDAELMLAAACRSSRTEVICGLAQIDEDAHERYAAMIARRRRHEPLAYILGRKEFYSLEFEVTSAVLIPRPETETVVATALQFIRDRGQLRVCDMGTGSGAIGLAIAANAPTVKLTATDISPEALTIARRNAVRLHLGCHARFLVADCFQPIDNMERLGRFDLIVSNPPYIREDQIAGLDPEISRFEPRLALSGGRDGLELYGRIAAGLSEHLERGGAAIVEIGAEQAEAVNEIMRNAGATSLTTVRDLAGLPRVIFASFR